MLARIRSDSRSGHRQDQIAKADIVDMLAVSLVSEDLLALARDERQDLDTRTAAMRKLWEASGVSDSLAVNEVRGFLMELLERARSEGHPAASLMIGVAYRLLRFRGMTHQDKTLVEEVYSFHKSKEPIDRWFRTQATMAGLVREPRERGELGHRQVFFHWRCWLRRTQINCLRLAVSRAKWHPVCRL